MSHRFLESQQEGHHTAATTNYSSISIHDDGGIDDHAEGKNADVDTILSPSSSPLPSHHSTSSRAVGMGLLVAIALVGSVLIHSSAIRNGENTHIFSSSISTSALKMEKNSQSMSPIGGRIKQDSDVQYAAASGDTYNDQNHSASSLVQERCDWVVGLFTEKYAEKSHEELRIQYQVQSQDSNVFYRATANIFWIDFVKHGWGDLLQFENIGIKPVQMDGTPLQPKSTWTWITGDQHLSNFGAWRNRHRDVVFSVNDFDEAAVYDFQVDVLRIAVSVCSHAFTNNLSKSEIDFVLRAFTDTYIETLVNYVGGDKELLFELTPDTASGAMKDYLEDLREGKSVTGQLEKFTEKSEKGGGERRFIHSDKTRLVPVDDATLQNIREQFTRDRFGSTMMKVGWHVRNWDDDFFEVLDVAARIGSGVGSYGVDRYYVLLKGTDDALVDGTDGNAVILDVKYEPPGAVTGILDEADSAWYNEMFINDAHRAVEAQRRLTSYVDPFTGWVIMDDEPFVVRQRSPWKGDYDLASLTDPDDFIDFMEQIAVATATSHARGSLAKSPGQFKHVISGTLHHWADRKTWGDAIASVAYEYRKQVLLDFECFNRYVAKHYPY